VAEEEVDELLERLRGERAVLEPVERGPAVGDVVSVKIAETEEDESQPYRFELGAGMALPDVEEAILSMEPGGSGEFDVRYPDDFEDAELAGQERRLHIELSDVKGKRLTELSDEFASEVGDFDTLDALRDTIREDLEKHHEREADQAVQERLIDSLIEANPFEVPASLIANYLDRVINAPENAEEEQVQAARRSLEPAAERQIKRQLILDRLIEEHELVATDEDVEERLRSLAEDRGAAVADLKRQLAREKQLDVLRQQLAIEKAFALLEAESTVQ
jgi:trigger factor